MNFNFNYGDIIYIYLHISCRYLIEHACGTIMSINTNIIATSLIQKAKDRENDFNSDDDVFKHHMTNVNAHFMDDSLQLVEELAALSQSQTNTSTDAPLEDFDAHDYNLFDIVKEVTSTEKLMESTTTAAALEEADLSRLIAGPEPIDFDEFYIGEPAENTEACEELMNIMRQHDDQLHTTILNDQQTTTNTTTSAAVPDDIAYFAADVDLTKFYYYDELPRVATSDNSNKKKKNKKEKTKQINKDLQNNNTILHRNILPASNTTTCSDSDVNSQNKCSDLVTIEAKDIAEIDEEISPKYIPEIHEEISPKDIPEIHEEILPKDNTQICECLPTNKNELLKKKIERKLKKTLKNNILHKKMKSKINETEKRKYCKKIKSIFSNNERKKDIKREFKNIHIDHDYHIRVSDQKNIVEFSSEYIEENCMVIDEECFVPFVQISSPYKHMSTKTNHNIYNIEQFMQNEM